LAVVLVAIPALVGCAPRVTTEEFGELQGKVTDLEGRVADLETLDNLLIVVDSSSEEPGKGQWENQYAAYIVAFLAKQLGGVETVTIFYGPQGVEMTKEGVLEKFVIEDPVKELIASQIEGLEAADLPDNLEALARFERDELGVNIASCGTFNVIKGYTENVTSKQGLEDFITPVDLSGAAEAIMSADKILVY
jgi:predicted peroxiredoxin